MNIFAYRGRYRTVTGTRYTGVQVCPTAKYACISPGAKPSATLQTDRHAYNARKRELSISLQTRDRAFRNASIYVCLSARAWNFALSFVVRCPIKLIVSIWVTKTRVHTRSNKTLQIYVQYRARSPDYLLERLFSNEVRALTRERYKVRGVAAYFRMLRVVHAASSEWRIYGNYANDQVCRAFS